MDRLPKTFYVLDQSTKSFKKMYFASAEPTGQKWLNESGMTKVTTVDAFDPRQELGEMEFEPITIKIHE